ncbi:trans-sialidase, putative,c71 surface protein, putative, partial [Trypanosoma cruzi]
MLAGNYSWTPTENDQAGDWGLMLVKGNVSKKDGEKSKRILWNDNYIIPWSYKGNQGSLKRLVGSGGSGVKMEDGTLVFPLEGTKKAKKEDGTEEDGKTVSLVIYSLGAAGWVLPKGMSADGCSDPSVVEWKEKFMMMTACDDGRRSVFAVAEAHCKKGEEGDFTGIASELLELTDEQEKELVTTELKTQVLEECTSEDKKGVCSIANQAGSQGVKNLHVGRPTTVVEGSDIYMLAGNYSWTPTENDQAGDWGLMLVKGNVSKKDGEKSKRILWNDNYIIPWSYKGNQGSLKRLVGSGGSGVKMEDGTLVFPLEGTKKAKKEDGTEEDGKTVSLVIYSLGAAGWVLPKGMSADGCSDPSVVEWGEK